MSKSKRSSTSLIGLIITVLVVLVGGYLASKGLLPTSLSTTPTEAPGAVTEAAQPGSTQVSAATQPSGGPTSGGAAQAGVPAWLHVFFTNPNVNDPNTVDQQVVPVVAKASQTIDVASFDLNLPSFVDALIAAKQRGVTVRVVADEVNGNQDLSGKDAPDGKDYNALKLLQAAKIPVVNGGRSSGLMHNKMIIVDGKTLFMGSWNMSFNDTNRNNNNVLEITDPTIIANYQAKYNELVAGGHFGTHATVGSKTPKMTLDGVQVENYFSPVDGVMAKLVAYVQSAKKSVHFIIFTYTDKDLAAAMIERAKAGVDVQGVIENRGASQGAYVPIFCAGLPVKVDGNKYTMHHKVIVIDGEFVITGSFNFTGSADHENDDNVLVIHSPAVAQLYEQEYQRVASIGVTQAASEVSCK